MTKPRDPEALLAAYFADGMEVLPDRVVDSVLDEVHRTRQRAVFRPWRTRSMSRTTLAAAAVAAVVALGGAFFVIRGLPAVGGPGPTASASASPSSAAVVGPSATPTATPSPTPTPIVWTEASLDEDWPAPVRAEPDGPATVVPILLKTVLEGTCPGDCTSTTTYGGHLDPSGDTGSAIFPWADISELTFCGFACVSIRLVSEPAPVVDPMEQWIAYGIVADTDRDGVPDWRYGTYILPPDVAGSDGPLRRWWRTDLHTGWTETSSCCAILLPSGTKFFGSPEGLAFGSDQAGVGPVGSVPERFYAWASVIQDGRVVATDYAPDAGWLEPSADAKAIDAKTTTR